MEEKRRFRFHIFGCVYVCMYVCLLCISYMSSFGFMLQWRCSRDREIKEKGRERERERERETKRESKI